MKDIKTTLYDWIGYLVPGIITAWAEIELVQISGGKVSETIFFRMSASIQLVIVLVVGYAIGHLLHALANLTIDHLPFGSYPPKNYFPHKFNLDFNSNIQAKLAVQIRERFQIGNESDSPGDIARKAYWLCYTHIMESKAGTLSETFLGLSGFYRGLSIGSFVTALTYLGIGILISNRQLLFVSGSSALVGLAFLSRTARFKRYLTKTVYTDFISMESKTISERGE